MSFRSTFRCAVAACAAFVACGAQAQGAHVLVRVTVAANATNADIVRIRDNIVSFGGQIKGFARGDVFVVSIAPRDIAAVASVHRVARVEALPLQPTASSLQRQAAGALTARQMTDLMPKSCTPGAGAKANAGLRAERAPRVAPNALAKRRILVAGGTAALPAAVDNSLSPHFPPIGDQSGRNSCAAWAAGYYYATYTQAADEGLDVSGVWLPRDPPCDILTDGKFDPAKFALCLPTVKDPPRPSRATEHIASPAFLYPLIHQRDIDANGQLTDDGGAFLLDAVDALAGWGIGSWQMKPYDPWLYDSVVYEWPTEAQWIEALPRRMVRRHDLDLGVDADFQDLKQHLANGELAVVGFVAYDNVQYWGWDRACQSQPGVCPGITEDVLYSNDGSTASGGHAITIVGYDDGKTYVDAASGQTRQGAFLIANSASPDWGVPNTAGGPGQGYFWVAYDYARANFGYVHYADDRPHYRPRLYAAFQPQAADRTSGLLYAGIGFHGGDFYPVYDRYSTPGALPRPLETTPRPFEADKRLVIDMTDGWPQLDPAVAVPLLYVAYDPYIGGTIAQADFYIDRRGNGVFDRLASPDGQKTVPMVPAPITLVCTDAPQNGDVNVDGFVDRTDVTLITSTMTRPPQCKADPRDMDRDGRITVLDARKAALRCTRPGCAPR
ncbi:MAG: dockerin type I domain-containing protein [Rubrivivax sp.]